MKVTESRNKSLLSLSDLHISYTRGRTEQKAVKGVSLKVDKGESVALVGESGSGKSSIARAVSRLIPIDSGRICFNGQDIHTLNRKDFLPYRKSIQLVFQDPLKSLNPSISIREILSEPLEVHFPELTRNQREEKIISLLDKVHLEHSALEKKPDAFSGGQRQRIVIARALAVEPEILICDEPVSALDVSIQAKILELLNELKNNLNISLLFISHDLAVVQMIAERVYVMKSGEIVECGTVEDVFQNPASNYTKLLIDACPKW